MRDTVVKLLGEACHLAHGLPPSPHKDDIIKSIEYTLLDTIGWIKEDKETEYKKESGR